MSDNCHCGEVELEAKLAPVEAWTDPIVTHYHLAPCVEEWARIGKIARRRGVMAKA